MSKVLARLFLRLAGWQVEGERPASKRYVMLGAPHTSNWDFIYMLAMARVLGIRVRWVGKHTLFRWPFGGLMRKLGGIPVNRASPGNFVNTVVSAFANEPEFELLIPPEGTRHFRPYWKSGFYRIAKAAGVPVVMAYVDYTRKAGGVGPSFMPSDDVTKDMDIIREFYANIRGAYPDQFSTPVLHEEQSVIPQHSD